MLSFQMYLPINNDEMVGQSREFGYWHVFSWPVFSVKEMCMVHLAVMRRQNQAARFKIIA